MASVLQRGLATFALMVAGEAVLIMEPPSGPYCGFVRMASGADAAIRLDFAESSADMAVEVQGMKFACKGWHFTVDATTGEVEYKQPDKQSCIEKAFANYSQDNDLVRMVKDLGSDSITIDTRGGRKGLLTSSACPVAGRLPARRLEAAPVKFKPGTYCGTVHTEDETDVEVKFAIVSESVAEITAQVFGLDIFCKEGYKMDPSSGTMMYGNLHKKGSCVQKEFKNFNQDPTGVTVKRVADPDLLKLHTASGATELTAEKCRAADTRRLSGSLILA
mmetsp:Transcript_13740/g.31117  ORF Transcript_13740/g.31117 Transcript_13740/m.31117 type:complete len:276 (-) Transcript_13740:102-929(-)|eukprot:CAMPEP_0197894596 /NCGR_PEP_ID=MMETSP1439-20131203/35909_1 /TAXON_ID=66791 /ORGANISM="Gonyaulax spinifera, Strain CCMP409" /LENGTH=275 /DNA_ID=CAMNT_0043514963 /DNA_START=69 /DNA_END=896 /DNA_ORIENTATION=-